MVEDPVQSVAVLEDDEGGPVKTFLEHLEDLRWVLIRCLVSLVLGMVTCLVGAKYIVNFLTWPLINSGETISLDSFGPLGGFTISMKIALYGGITLAIPFILYFVGDFVMPALKKTEKTYFLRAFLIGTGLFMAGLMLCYFVVLQISLKGLVLYNRWLGLAGNQWRAEEYFHFVIMFMMGMGISFEVPVVILTLVRLGVISHETLVKSRSYMFIGNLVFCAFITPDAISTIFMVIPVQVLLEICIMISRHWEKQRRIAEAASLASERIDSGAST